MAHCTLPESRGSEEDVKIDKILRTFREAFHPLSEGGGSFGHHPGTILASSGHHLSIIGASCGDSLGILWRYFLCILWVFVWDGFLFPFRCLLCVEGSRRGGAGAPVVGPFRFDWEASRSDAYEFFRAFSS